MCLGVPGQIVDVTDPEHGLAAVDVGGKRQTVNCQMLTGTGESLAPGDWVVVHLGFAVERLDRAEAMAILAYLADPTASLPDIDRSKAR